MDKENVSIHHGLLLGHWKERSPDIVAAWVGLDNGTYCVDTTPLAPSSGGNA